MIGSAKRKLKQNSGATILMALMLFLACVTIAGVILGSAMTNLNKVKNQQEQLQVYESVSSAARLVCQRIQGVEYTAWERVTIHHCSEYSIDEEYECINDPKIHESAKYEYNKPEITADENGKGVKKDDIPNITQPDITQLIQEGVEEVYRSELKYEGNQSLVKPFTQWEKSFEIDDSKCKVNVTVSIDKSIDKDYQLTFKFRPLDEKWKDDYNVTLLVPAVLTKADEGKDSECEHTFYLQKKDDKTVTTTKKSFNVEQTTKTTTITYSTGTIYKGASGE